MLLRSALLRFSLLGAALLFGSTVSLADSGRFPPGPHIYVHGEARLKLKPDFVEIRYTVARTLPQISAAKKAVDEIANKAATAAQKLGIRREDLQASEFSVQPDYDFENGKRRYRGTRVARSFTVHLRDLDKVGEWNNALIAAGVDDIQSFTVGVDQREEKLATLRTEALKSARTEADRLSAALGQKVIGVHTISDTPIGEGGQIAVRSLAMKAEVAEQAPELPDSLELSAQAWVVFTMSGKEVLQR